MRRAGSPCRPTSRRRSAFRPAPPKACPTANIACTCCSARFRRRGRRSRRQKVEGVAFQLRPIYGVTIPVIIRLGHLEAKAGIANVRKVTADGKPAIALDISRAGDRSTFGEVKVFKAGVADPIAIVSGIAVYTEVGQRSVTIPIDPAQLANANGQVTVQYVEPTDTGPVTLAETTRGPSLRSGRRGAGTYGAAANPLDARRFGVVALAVAGAVAAWAASPVGPAWTADPDEQFLLDVNIRQLRLGDGVRAYQTPEGTCVVFGDFLTTLDLPMKIDLAAKKASGWAFREDNRIEIDQAAGTARFGDKQEKLAEGTIRETPEGWCVDSAALGRWFKLGVKPVTAGIGADARIRGEIAGRAGARARAARRPAPPGVDAARRPAQGQAALSHVARPGARFHRPRRRHLSGVDRNEGRSPRLGAWRRAKSPACPTTACCRPTRRAGRNRCASRPIARIPTAACSDRSTRPISRSATSRPCRTA